MPSAIYGLVVDDFATRLVSAVAANSDSDPTHTAEAHAANLG
jgi:hypothetical protein